MVQSTAVETSDLYDPLVNNSSFSFNPSSIFRPLSNPNFDSLSSHLIIMAGKNPDSLVNQAKIIKDGCKDPVESDKTAATTSEDKLEDPITAKLIKPKERRPGLGLKPAKFSMKPISSQSEASLVPDLDIDKLSDPVEFFAAVDRMEFAKKELRRLKGLPLEEIDVNRVSIRDRPRRPGLLGEPAVYIHRTYPSVGTPSNNVGLISSQEAHDQNIMIPPGEDAMPETNSRSSPQTRVSDVKPAISKLSELDELLSYDYEGLDDVAVQNFLEEKLNLKALDIDEPSLPDLPVVRRRESGSSIDILANMKDTIFQANDSSKASTSKPLNFSYHFRKSSNNQVSPSLLKSPLSSISTLNKHLSRLTPLKDPFPFLPIDIDSSPEVLSHLKAQNSKQGDQIGKKIDSHEIPRSSVNEEETNEAVLSLPGSAGNIRIPNVESEVLFGGVANNDPLVTSKDPHEFGSTSARGEDDTEISSEILPSAIIKHVDPCIDSVEWMNENRQTEQTSTMENLFETGTPTNEENNLKVLDDVSDSAAANNVNATSESMEENQTAGVPEFATKEVFSDGSAMEKAIVKGGDVEMAEPLNTQGTSIGKPNKKTDASLNNQKKNIDEDTLNKGRKRKAKSKAAVTKEPKNKKKAKDALAQAPPTNLDENLRRHSLYGAGTKWEAGVRRSTRIRMRPLEFWRGERFLYGRVHASVVSVIGVKYASPAKNGDERTLKVKSFVSDKYKNMLDLAALH